MARKGQTGTFPPGTLASPVGSMTSAAIIEAVLPILGEGKKSVFGA